MRQNIQVGFKKQKITPQLDFSIYRKNSSPLCPDRIPHSQAIKFQTTLHFLKQTPIHNHAEQQFIQKIQHQAFINKFELNQILRSIKVDKNLLLTIKNYFTLSFSHQKQLFEQPANETKLPLNNYVTKQQSQYQIINPSDTQQNRVNEQKLHDRLILLSAYETMKVKILIQALLFLKDIHQGKFIHKKLINQFQKLQLLKKLQILSSTNLTHKQTQINQKTTKKSSIYFKQKQKEKQQCKRSLDRNGQQNKNQTGVFSIIKSKIFTIIVLEYQKLQTPQTLFKSHLKLIENAIEQRQNRFQLSCNSYYLSSVQSNHSKLETTQSKVETNQETIQFDNKGNVENENDKKDMGSNYKLRMQYENTSGYLVLLLLKLKIQFQGESKVSNILRELKVRRNECKNMIDKLEQSLGNIVKLKNSPQVEVVRSYISSKKIYLKSLNQIMNQMKQRLQRELMGQSTVLEVEQTSRRKSEDKSINQERKFSSTNYESVKNSIYQLTLNILQQNKPSFVRDRSNQRILQQYIRTHNKQKGKKQQQPFENNFLSPSNNNNTETKTINKINLNRNNKSKEIKIDNKSRSITRIRQNLHQNIFPKQESKRSKSLLNNKNQTSIKTLLQSPLNRQIEIFLEYQKFLNSTPQQPQNSNSSQIQSQFTQKLTQNNSNPIKQKSDNKALSSQKNNKSLNKSNKNNNQIKVQQNGIKLLDDIMKAKQSNTGNKFLTSDKKRKIKTIYKAFAYNNKIIDISHWKLEQEIRDSSKGHFFDKKNVSSQLTQSVCNFGAGLKDFNQALDELLADRCYMNIRFVKFWQNKPCFYSIRLSQQKNIFTLYLKVNQLTITMLLPRGNNILCERYHTIWPTIRYLFQKKIFQFPIIKFFQHIFYQKKSNNFTQNKSQNINQSNAQSFSRSNKINFSQFNNKQSLNSRQSSTSNFYTPLNSKNDPNEQFQKKNPKRLIGKDSIASSSTSQLYQHNQLEENQCTAYESTFGDVSSDEVEEINSCFDYIHKFMGLISSQTKSINGNKDAMWPLQDNANMKQMNEIAQIGQQNVEKLFKQDQRGILKKLFLWRRIAKFWVSMQERNSVHLLNFVKKVSNQNYYFFSISMPKQTVVNIIETFLENQVFQPDISQKQKFQIRKKYKANELNFEITWRECNKSNSPSQNKQNYASVNLSYERLQLYHLDLKFITDSLMNLIVDNYYDSKIIIALKKLFQDSLFIETSVEGQKVYDIYASKIQKNKKLYLINNQTPIFKDLYQNPLSNTLKLVFDFLKFKNHQQQIDLSETKHKKTNSNLSFYNSIFPNQKNQIQVIQNFFDMMAWNHRQNQVRFKPNSKWKVVQRKIHTIITFVNHLSKKNQRKSSLIGTQKIKQTHQFVETNQTKKLEKISPLMMKALQRVKKSTLNFLQKIQNEVYRIKVNLNESLNTQNQGNSHIQKWMAECILMKQNSKQYQKFYISSADIQNIFLSPSKKVVGNQSQSFSESYDLFNSYGSKQLKKAIKSNKKQKNLFSKVPIKNNSFFDKNSEQNSLKEIDQSLNQSLSEGQRQGAVQQNNTKKMLIQWRQFLQDGQNVFLSKAQSKEKKLRMFGKIIRSISFTKIKCFSKILISRDFQSEDGVEHFIAEPRNSLQILHQNIENPQKTFELKYFVPLQNCYQTIICKPIKVSYKGKIDFVILTLFKINLKQGENIYQFRINLNKNQTYYACEVTQSELRNLVNFSQQQKMSQHSVALEQDSLPIFSSDMNSDNINLKSEQKQKYRPSFVNPNPKVFHDDKHHNSSSHKQRSILKPGQYRNSNLLNIQYASGVMPQNTDSQQSECFNGTCNNFILAMVGKLQQFTKEVLQNIFKHIQIQIISDLKKSVHQNLLLTIPEAGFQKELKIRVFERISRDKSCIYMVEINEDNIRQLNQIVIKSSLNNNFDIFQQNIFKNKKRKISEDLLSQISSVSQESDQRNSVHHASKKKQNVRISCSQFVSKVRSIHHQSEINLLFSSFSIYRLCNKKSKKIQVMNSDNVIENIAYEVEKKYGKQILLKFNNKKIKSYAEIFFNYFLKYINPTQKQNH